MASRNDRALINSPRMRLPTLVTVVVFCFATTTVAQVRDNKQLARELFNEGNRLYDLNDYAKALDSFRKAYLAYEEPSLLFNIAQCQRQLALKEEAIKSYQSYLRKMPSASNRVEVERLIAKLHEQIEEDRRAADALERSKQVPSARPDPVGSIETPQQQPNASVATVVVSSTVPNSPPRRARRTALIAGAVVLGVGVVGIATGSAGAALAADAQSELNRLNRQMDVFDPSAEKRGRSMQLVSIVGFAVGGAAAVAGAVTMAFGARRVVR